MPFQKNNKLGFTSGKPLDKQPVCFKVKEGSRDELLKIPGWQNKLREFVEQLISGQNRNNE